MVLAGITADGGDGAGPGANMRAGTLFPAWKKFILSHCHQRKGPRHASRSKRHQRCHDGTLDSICCTNETGISGWLFAMGRDDGIQQSWLQLSAAPGNAFRLQDTNALAIVQAAVDGAARPSPTLLGIEILEKIRSHQAPQSSGASARSDEVRALTRASAGRSAI